MEVIFAYPLYYIEFIKLNKEEYGIGRGNRTKKLQNSANSNKQLFKSLKIVGQT